MHMVHLPDVLPHVWAARKIDRLNTVYSNYPRAVRSVTGILALAGPRSGKMVQMALVIQHSGHPSMRRNNST